MSRMLPSHVTLVSFLRKLTLALVMAGAVGMASAPVLAEGHLDGPTVENRNVALVVGSFLRNEHLTQHPLDDEIAERWMTLYLKSLDLRKLYFYQADIDRFTLQQHKLDDAVRRGDIDVAFEVFNVLLDRVDERTKMIDELLQEEFDFTVDEEIIRDPDDAEYPRSPQAARDLWRKRIKLDLLVLKAGKEPIVGDAAREKLTRRYHSAAKRLHQIDGDELVEMYLTALTMAYDPHSTYMSPHSLENFEIQMRLQLDGIGAQLQFEDGYTVVNKIIPGGAADKDGRLKEGDRIVGVGQGTDGEMEDVVDMKLDDVVEQIRGKRGTVVRLEVIPDGKSEHKVYEITRAQIELADSRARGEVVTEKRGDREYRVGVINLPSFYMDMDGARRGMMDYRSTTRDVSALLEDFKKQNIDAVVVDLRENGGGALTEAISLTGLFIDEGPIVQVKDKDNNRQPYNDERGTLWDGPLVVLISKQSASASEIFAGAIQDYGRGLIVGDKATHGKGTVQSLLSLGPQMFAVPNAREMGALKITMQQFYRPNGASTQNLGVESDVVLPSFYDELGLGESELDFAMTFDQIDAVPFRKLELVTPAVVHGLRALSEQRLAASTDFQRLIERIEKYRERKNAETLTLNEAKFMAQQAEADNEEEILEELFGNDHGADNPVVKRDFYFNETLHITLDYVEALEGQTASQAGPGQQAATGTN